MATSVPARYRNSKFVTGLANKVDRARRRKRSLKDELAYQESPTRVAIEDGLVAGSGAFTAGMLDEAVGMTLGPVKPSFVTGVFTIGIGAGIGSAKVSAAGWGQVLPSFYAAGQAATKKIKVTFASSDE